MDDADAWQPAYESLGDQDYIIPTKSAEKLMDLLEIVTGTFPCPRIDLHNGSRTNAETTYEETHAISVSLSIIERYRPLTVLEHRTFLLDIQLDILIAYHRHIRGLVDQYESMTYSFARVMPGAVSAEELETIGVEGLRNLCQWFSSVEYISSTLKDWGEDIVSSALHALAFRERYIQNATY